MKIRLDDGQIAYVVGGKQTNTNRNSSAPFVETLKWGVQDSGLHQVRIASGMSFSEQYGWGDSHVYFLTSPKPLLLNGNILGGIQENSNIDSTQPWLQTGSWGLTVSVQTPIASFHSYSRDYEWGNNRVTVNANEATPWQVLVGVSQAYNNMNSSAEWITDTNWGTPTGPKGLIATLQAQSPQYGWGNSHLFFHFAEA